MPPLKSRKTVCGLRERFEIYPSGGDTDESAMRVLEEAQGKGVGPGREDILRPDFPVERLAR
jgi:hypothetical protein